MLNKKCLNSLSVGKRAVVTHLENDDDIRRRLLDIGIIPGTVLECVGVSPMGDPKAFLIRGGVIALRSEDSENIFIDSVRG